MPGKYKPRGSDLERAIKFVIRRGFESTDNFRHTVWFSRRKFPYWLRLSDRNGFLEVQFFKPEYGRQCEQIKYDFDGMQSMLREMDNIDQERSKTVPTQEELDKDVWDESSVSNG